tara:strand:+ start:2622 stop:2897 length:276 start_codon:yes stop_codon:yes gene_type:complete
MHQILAPFQEGELRKTTPSTTCTEKDQRQKTREEPREFESEDEVLLMEEKGQRGRVSIKLERFLFDTGKLPQIREQVEKNLKEVLLEFSYY